MSIAGKKIIISGGGIAGLTFGLSLQHYCKERKIQMPEIVIYERDATLSHRSYQGYSFSIRGGGGADVLRALNLYDKCVAHRTPGHRGRICEVDMKPLLDLSLEQDGKTFRIARYQLRNDLLEEMPKEWIRWNTGCINAEQFTSEDGSVKVRVYLNNGGTDEGDLLIVADGVKSKIAQKLMTPQQYNLHFEGAMTISGRSKLQRLPPELLESFYMVMSPGSCVFLASVSETEAVWGLTYLSKEPEKERRGDDPTCDTKAILIEAQQRAQTHKYRDPVPLLIETTDPATIRVFACTDRLPVPCVKPNIVFIGDANHAMSPFSANGANMAMLDSLYLADQLTSSKHSAVVDALVAFDKETKVRSTKAITVGRQGVWSMHSSNFFVRKARNTFLRVVTFLVKYGHYLKYVTLLGLLASGGFLLTKYVKQH